MAVNDEDLIGYYDLRQLSSAEETSRQKKRVGVFPWSKAKIRRLVKSLEFLIEIGRASCRERV